MSDYYGYGLNPAIVGRTLASVELSEDKEVLTLIYADGTASRYRAEGDCCSSSWVEHLAVPADIAGSVITGVTEGDYGAASIIGHGVPPEFGPRMAAALTEPWR